MGRLTSIHRIYTAQPNTVQMSHIISKRKLRENTEYEWEITRLIQNRFFLIKRHQIIRDIIQP
jgi:hypothetical protein